MNKIPTAKKYIEENENMETLSMTQEQLMISFAQLHVEAALAAAGDIANEWENSGELKPEILSAYPKELIQ